MLVVIWGWCVPQEEEAEPDFEQDLAEFLRTSQGDLHEENTTCMVAAAKREVARACVLYHQCVRMILIMYQRRCDLPAQQMRQENPQAEVVREEPHQEIPVCTTGKPVQLTQDRMQEVSASQQSK